MRIKTGQCIALGIDFQERLMPVVHAGDEVVRRSRILFSGLSLLQVPIVISRQYPKGLGDTVPAIREAAAGAAVHDKTAFSCFEEPELRAALEASGRRTVIVAGVEAHICVLQTVIDLRANGFQVVFAADCTGSRNPDDKALALHRAMQEGAIPSGCESLLFELATSARNPVFKDISALIK